MPKSGSRGSWATARSARSGGRGGALASADHGVVVVGGEHPTPPGYNRSVHFRGGSEPGRFPLGVFRGDDLRCLYLVTTRDPVTALAFHPHLPLVTVGTGSYDGGWNFSGELLLIDLTDGTVVSLLSESRQVQRISWRDEQTLDLVLAVPNDYFRDLMGTRSVECTIRREDWDRPTPGMLQLPYREWPAPDEPDVDPRAAVDLVERLSREHGAPRTQRSAVRALETLSDGRLVAALEGVRAECWSPAGQQLWRLPAGTELEDALHLRVLPEETTALSLTRPQPGFTATGWEQPPSRLTRVSLTDGVGLTDHPAPAQAILVGRADGLWAVRDTDNFGRPPDPAVEVRRPDGDTEVTVDLGPSSGFGHCFAVRRSPELLLIQERPVPEEPGDHPWVVAIDVGDSSVRPLFLLAWDPAHRVPGLHLHGGPGVLVDDYPGPSLIHAGQICEDNSRTPGDDFVSCRSYPSGDLQWVHRPGSPVAALDADPVSGLVQVVLYSGNLVILRASDGDVVLRRRLTAGGFPVVPLSVTHRGPGRLAVGTLDGRILLLSAP